MLFRRATALTNLVAPLWFSAVYLVMSGRRPDYSHATDAISELGSLDAPDLWTWNLLGYILPGIAIALLGIALRPVFASRPLRSALAAFGLVSLGLLMALSGAFPADMSDFSSLTTRLHLLGAMGSYVGFLLAGFSYPGLFAGHRDWAWISTPSPVLVVLSIASGFLRFWGDMPGVGQRITFTLVFLWVGLVGFALLRSTRRSHPSDVVPGAPVEP